MVFNTALSYVQNTEDAEEITQDVFVEVHQSIASFRGESSLKTWIYRITIHKSLDVLKYKQRKKRFAIITSLFQSPSEHAAEKHPPDFVHPGVLLEDKEKATYLFNAINKLPENQKTAFILSKIEGLGNIEISTVMQNSVGAVESLLSRAKQNLKTYLSNYYDSI